MRIPSLSSVYGGSHEFCRGRGAATGARGRGEAERTRSGGEDADGDEAVIGIVARGAARSTPSVAEPAGSPADDATGAGSMRVDAALASTRERAPNQTAVA